MKSPRRSRFCSKCEGKVIFSVGNKRSVFPNSAIKPIQALMLLETGAAKAFDLGLAQIALALRVIVPKPIEKY